MLLGGDPSSLNIPFLAMASSTASNYPTSTSDKDDRCGICIPSLSVKAILVSEMRLDYGSRGHQVPTMPRVPSSARGKRSTRRKKDEMRAFDLLVTVAGTLLADQENSSNVPNTNKAAARYAKNRKSIKAEQFDEALPLQCMAAEKCIVGSGSACAFSRQANICLAENSSTRNEADSVLESLTANMLVKDSLFSCTKSCELGRGLGRIPEYRANGVRHPGSTRSPEANQVQQAKPDGDTTALYSLAGFVDVNARPPALVSSDSSSVMPLCSHDKDHDTSPLCQAEVQHAADRDDDENSSGCTHPSTPGNKGRVPHYIGDNRIRKWFASKLMKAAHNKICEEMSNKGIGLSAIDCFIQLGSKLNFCRNKISTTCQQAQRAMFKRKKLARHHFTPSSAKGILTEVKLRIKSFNIPELFIDIPENATVGSLKRTIMDVITSIIEGGLRVGVLLQGKNIQDDNKTLRQAGICHGEKLDNIDFTLECEAGHNPPPGVIVPEEMDFLGADVVEPLARMKCEEPFPDIKVGDDNHRLMQASPNRLLSDPCSVHSLVEMPVQETSASSQAIVPVASPNLEALAIVPLCKSKQSDIGQRRIRRPFSVAEVEALVEAVEHLGTGRWRDVKMRAFDNADHRTYVDLKDKWKTLVHTASISPQQRRGEPVPQELLDRVLSAQAY